MLHFVVIITLVSYLNAAAPQCRFAPLFNAADLLTSPSKQDEFLRAVSYWEGKFHSPGVGYHQGTGLTFDGHGLNYTTGETADPLHFWTAASKESIHLMMLALALKGNPYAQIFVSPDAPEKANDKAMDLLSLKIRSYQTWDTNYPGYGGYLPWVYVYDSGVVPANGWGDSVPALDNGEMIWGIYAVAQILTQKSKQNNTIEQAQSYKTLAYSYRSYFDKLAKNAVMMFYDGQGCIRAVAGIKNVKAQPSPDNYYNKNANYYLDDPYEGELFAFFMDMYGTWPNPQERENIWVKKRAKLASVNYPTPYGPITVQRGFWFSAHEQWKYLELPYLDVPINQRLFVNGEKARTWNSALKGISGLYASVSDVTSGGPVANYLSALGIQEIASEIVLYYDVITPYGSMNIMMANLSVGLVWYHNMLLGPKMQGIYGSTESIWLNGTEISPVVTWDSKITTLAAMLGGVYEIVGTGLKADNQYNRFYQVVDREWSLKFPTISGENLDFKLPTSSIPMKEEDFTLCHG